MSSRSHMMGAGFACSSLFLVNPNQNTSGGNKKQGLTSRVGLGPWADRAIQINANGSIRGRNMIFIVNQLSGVGRGKSQFNVPGSYATKDGVRKKTVLPTFPVLKFSNYNNPLPENFSVYFPEPYFRSEKLTISLTVESTTADNRFEIVSYPTPVFDPSNFFLLQTPLEVGTTIYNVTNPNPERYLSTQIFKGAGLKSFVISSFKINGTEQLSSPLIRP